MSVKIETMKNEASQMLEEGKAILNVALSESRELTTEENQKFHRIKQGIHSLNAQIDIEQAKEAKAVADGNKSAARDHFSQVMNGAGRSRADIAASQVAVDQASQFTSWSRGGEHTEFTLTTGTASGGMVPTEVSPPQIVRRLVNAFVAAKVATGGAVMSFGNTGSVNVPVTLNDGCLPGVNPGSANTFFGEITWEQSEESTLP